jgi:hypothetical protein
VCFILAVALFDGRYEFKDANGMLHRLVNSTQQAIARFPRGDSVPVAYSRIDPERARIDTLWFNHRWVIGGIIVGLSIAVRALGGAPRRKIQISPRRQHT